MIWFGGRRKGARDRDPPKSDPAAPASGASVPRHAGGRRSDRLWFRFRQRRLALASLVILALLLLAAALAPFLAGNRPLVIVVEGRLTFPVLQALTRDDVFWLAGLGTLLVAWPVSRLLRSFRAFGRKTRRSPRATAIVLAVLTLATLAIGLTWPERLMHDNYLEYRDGLRSAEFCLFPILPYGPNELQLHNTLQPPSLDHWFGTDREGADILSRMIHGTRISFIVAFTAVAICLVIGLALGCVAGYFGGAVDSCISRLIEVVTCFPVFFAVLAVLSFLPPSIFWVMLLIGLVRWPSVARLTRAEFLKLRESSFVLAAKALGLPAWRIMARHMLPNALAPIIVAATFGMAGAILVESGLSFLGIGPIGQPSWGRLLSEFRAYFEVAWWLSVFPGAAIFVTVTAFNLIGEGLRDALDVRIQS